jgi:hypothetical protein
LVRSFKAGGLFFSIVRDMWAWVCFAIGKRLRKSVKDLA